MDVDAFDLSYKRARQTATSQQVNDSHHLSHYAAERSKLTHFPNNMSEWASERMLEWVVRATKQTVEQEGQYFIVINLRVGHYIIMDNDNNNNNNNNNENNNNNNNNNT